ncbi:MAG: hypothetical protein AAF680_13355 [Pseudomonadota bacterium]
MLEHLSHARSSLPIHEISVEAAKKILSEMSLLGLAGLGVADKTARLITARAVREID